MQESEAAAAAAAAADDALLERAAALAAARDSAARQLPPSAEPKRGKAHWDHVLEEMAWMAKEFQRCALAGAAVQRASHSPPSALAVPGAASGRP